MTAIATGAAGAVPLGSVASVAREIVKPEAVAGSIFVGLEHIMPDGTIEGARRAEAGDVASAKFRFGPQDLLFGKLRPNLRKVARPDSEGVCSTDILPIRPGPKVDRAYLFHWLRSPGVTRLATQRTSGANLPRLSPAELLRIRIPLPPIAEQRRIAAILDKADAIRRKRQQAIQLTEDLLHSTFLKIVGPNHPEFGRWPTRRVDELAARKDGAIRSGPFGSDLRHSEFVEEGIAVLGIDNAVNNRFEWVQLRFITAEKFRRLERYRVYPGDVIVTIMGTTGRSAVVPQDIPTAISTKHLATITPDLSLVDAEFLSNALHRHPAIFHQVRAANRGAIMPGLNLGLLKALKVPLPPLSQQKVFSKALASIRALQARLIAYSVESSALMGSLVQRAFRGKLPRA